MEGSTGTGVIGASAARTRRGGRRGAVGDWGEGSVRRPGPLVGCRSTSGGSAGSRWSVPGNPSHFGELCSPGPFSASWASASAISSAKVRPTTRVQFSKSNTMSQKRACNESGDGTYPHVVITKDASLKYPVCKASQMLVCYASYKRPSQNAAYRPFDQDDGENGKRAVYRSLNLETPGTHFV